MNLLQIMQNRRSVRNYTGEKIPKEKLDKILQAGLLSASGRNKKPWEFVVVQEKETLEKLSHCRVGAAKMLKNAGCAILVFANPDKTDVWVEDGRQSRTWKLLDTGKTAGSRKRRKYRSILPHIIKCTQRVCFRGYSFHRDFGRTSESAYFGRIGEGKNTL